MLILPSASGEAANLESFDRERKAVKCILIAKRKHVHSSHGERASAWGCEPKPWLSALLLSTDGLGAGLPTLVNLSCLTDKTRVT